jgi:hypothetical protein
VSGEWQQPQQAQVSTDSPQAVVQGGGVTETPRTTLPNAGLESVPFKPAGVELWQALLAAQVAAKELVHDASVGSEKKELYAYTSSEAFIREARRVLHERGLLIVQLGTIGAPLSRSLQRLFTAYLLVHAPSGQGLVLPHEWPIHSTEKFPPAKSTGAAYTSSMRYFLRGLLLIVTGDTIEETDPDAQRRQQPQQAYPPQAQAWYPPQGYAYQQQAASQPPAAWGPPQLPYNPGAQQQQWNTTPQHAPALLQSAQQELQSAPISGNAGQALMHPPQNGQQWQQSQQQTAPPSGPANPAAVAQQAARVPAGLAAEAGKAPTDLRPGEPVEADEWVNALVARGWAERDAEQFAGVNLDKPITQTMREALRGWIERYYGDDNTSATKAWVIDAGFTPRPDMPEADRPRPTGRQALRYLHAMNWAARAASAAR